jgi:hypothetical protein
LVARYQGDEVARPRSERSGRILFGHGVAP